MQKIGILTLLMMATILFMLAFPAIAAGPNPPAPPVAAVPAAPAAPAAAAAMPERHPHIDEALEHMQAAKHELEIAAHDFKGHRVKALEHLNQAIGEAETCLKVGD
jgi:hypothetical protein